MSLTKDRGVEVVVVIATVVGGLKLDTGITSSVAVVVVVVVVLVMSSFGVSCTGARPNEADFFCILGSRFTLGAGATFGARGHGCGGLLVLLALILGVSTTGGNPKEHLRGWGWLL